MRRHSTPALLLSALLLVLAVALVGCDETPNSSEDFRLQGTMDPSSSSFSVGPDEPSAEFGVDFQGLQDFPTAETEFEAFEVTQVAEEGTPENGERRWRLSLTGELGEVLVQEPLLIRGTTTQGREIVDTISVRASSISISSNFTSSFYTLADYEGDVTEENYELAEDFTPDEVDTEPYEGGQRLITTTGGTEVSLINADPDPGTPSGENQPEGSNGVRFIEINATSGGAATIERRTNLPNSDFFSFLVRQTSTSFTLSITFTEEANGGNVEHQVDLPIPEGNEWLKIQFPFSTIGDDFDPVATRSGGSGPLVSVRLSADANVNYAVDEFLFGLAPTEQTSFRPRVEFHDFEETTLAFGPPLSDNTFGFSTIGVDENPMVADFSDGYTSRLVSGSATWGYDLIGGAFGSEHGARVDVDGDDVLSFLVKDQSGESSFEISFQSDGDLGEAVLVDDFPQGEWERVEIPMSSFGTPQDALDPGLRGFNVANQEGSDFLIDDIKIMPKN